jgi:membrane protein DedA with SNARE-associated domain/rhodanese-related sulfurtransferase
MAQTFVALFSQYGLLVVIVNVLLDGIGLPVPALPTLILAGSLAATSVESATDLFFGTIGASLIGETGWYLAGRRYGGRVMKLLCRISISPDSCVGQTQLRFERWGSGALIVSKFVPGLSIVAPPLAGATAMRGSQFLLYAALGSALWAAVGLGIGIALRAQIAALLPLLQQVGATLLEVLVAVLLAYIAYKYYQRRQFYRALRMARISVNELYRLMQAGADPLIVDVRSASAHALDPRTIPGALRITLPEIEQQLQALPRQRDIVLYCSCPNEASAAQVARLLMDHGFQRVRPLHGGLDAWIEAGYSASVVSASGSLTVLAR